MIKRFSRNVVGSWRQLAVAGRLTPAVHQLLTINLLIFLVQQFFNDRFISAYLGLSREGIANGFYWQFFTYMFMHSKVNLLHIAMNMMVLAMIGPDLERKLGRRDFITMYIFSGFMAGAAYIALGSHAPCIGASGAIFGLLGAMASLWPLQYISVLLFFIIPITTRVWILVAVLTGLELLLLVVGINDNVAHGVHISGAIVGFCYTWFGIRKKGFPGLSALKLRRPPKLHVVRSAPEKPSQEEVDAVLDKMKHTPFNDLNDMERDILRRSSRSRGGKR